MLVGAYVASETVFKAAEYDNGHLGSLAHPGEELVQRVLVVADKVLAVGDEQHALLYLREILVQLAVESVPVGGVHVLRLQSVADLVAVEQ